MAEHEDLGVDMITKRPRTARAEHEDLGVDMITKRPRTARDQYTVLTDTQKKNIHSDPSSFFMVSKPETPYPEKGWTKDRYATSTSQYLVRGKSGSNPYCWIDKQWQREPPAMYCSSRLGAADQWGPANSAGSRTMQHLNNYESAWRFTTTEVYRRPATNISGEVYQEYARPTTGYYAPRNPSTTTWFGSNVPLNNTSVLEDIRPKTMAEYEAIRKSKAQELLQRKHKFPAYTEYTDRYTIGTKIHRAPKATIFIPEMFVRLENRRRYLEEEQAAA